MKKLLFFLVLFALTFASSRNQTILRNEDNFVRQFKEQEGKMKAILESPFVRDLLERESLDPTSAETTLTEERLASEIVRNMETIYGELEGQAVFPCFDDIQTYFINLSSEADYAWQMRTAGGSFGRLFTVFFTWRLEYPGSYDLCVDTKRHNPDAPFETMYCTEHIPFGDDYLKRGRCLPANCTNDDLNIIYNTVYAILGFDFYLGEYYTCIRDVPWEWDAIYVTCWLGFFVLIVAIGTCYDIVSRRRRSTIACEETPVELESQTDKGTDTNGQAVLDVESNGKIHASDIHNGPTKHQSTQELFMTSEEEREDDRTVDEESNRNTTPPVGRLQILRESCSAILTADKILSAKKNSSSLNCLNGIRVLSMFWIIWGHCNNFIIYQRLANLRHLVEDVASRYNFNATLFATYSVDTFFVLSGLLVTYLTLKELNAKKGSLNWALFYIHRFWRLTPVYMMVVAYYTSLRIHVGTGADKVEYDTYDANICREYWWANLIYINNLYPFPGYLGGCMGWSWYLACDMQFFIVAPLFLYLLYNRKTTKIGLVLVVTTCFLSCIVTAALTGYYGLPVGKSTTYYNDRMENLEPYSTNSDVVYGKPYTRIQSYMVGIFVGYMLYRHFHVKKINMHWMRIIIGWFIALSILYASLYSMDATGERDEPLPQWFSAVWGGLNRTLWSIAVAWVAFACSTGRGGLLNSLLSLSFWTPMARLTYGAYLVHPIIIFGFLRTKKILFYWSYFEMIFLFFAVTVSSYLIAFLLSIFIEGPTMGLERAIFGKKK